MESSHPQVSLALWSASQSDLEGATMDKLLSEVPQFVSGIYLCYKHVNRRNPASSINKTGFSTKV